MVTVPRASLDTLCRAETAIARKKHTRAQQPATSPESPAGSGRGPDAAGQQVSTWRMPGWALAALWLLVVVGAAALQWSDGKFKGRGLIDYDDFEIIRPMLKLDWQQYWSEWFPDRTNYAFPLRDVTHFFDQWVAGFWSFGIAWVTQFSFFALTLALHVLVFARVLSPGYLWVAIPFTVYALHPLQTETLQWMTCRKYVVPGLFLAAGALLITRWRDKIFRHNRMVVLFVLWLLALLCYPTAAFWMHWVIFAFWLWGHSLQRLWPWIAAATATMVLYLFVVGSGTGEVSAGLTSAFTNHQKSWFFGSNAIGRGFWNLLFPFWLAPYYNEMSWRNYLGLALFVIVGLAVVLRLTKVAGSQSRNIREGVVWLTLGTVLLVPTANTIMTFHDFMLADRHMYLSLPYFVLGAAVLIRAGVDGTAQNKPSRVLARRLAILSATGVWLFFAARTVVHYVPLWRNSFLLMEQCALTEGSPRCHSQAIRRVFFKDKCHMANHIIGSAATLYKSFDSKWSLEFRTEVPFFHAACLALSASLSSNEKLTKIDGLHEFYGESPEVIFGLVLASLEKGNKQEALGLAAQYYMGSLDKGAIFITYSLLGTYKGQMEVLCKLDPYGPCPLALERFSQLHPAADSQKGSRSWGRSATELMARRGGLM